MIHLLDASPAPLLVGRGARRPDLAQWVRQPRAGSRSGPASPRDPARCKSAFAVRVAVRVTVRVDFRRRRERGAAMQPARALCREGLLSASLRRVTRKRRCGPRAGAGVAWSAPRAAASGRRTAPGRRRAASPAGCDSPAAPRGVGLRYQHVYSLTPACHMCSMSTACTEMLHPRRSEGRGPREPLRCPQRRRGPPLAAARAGPGAALGDPRARAGSVASQPHKQTNTEMKHKSSAAVACRTRQGDCRPQGRPPQTASDAAREAAAMQRHVQPIRFAEARPRP